MIDLRNPWKRYAKDGIKIFGKWKGVQVGVTKNDGNIATVFPTYYHLKLKKEVKMDRISLSEILEERERIWTECEDNWAEGIERCAMNAVSVINDINGFFSYLKSDCTSKEFLYITDWFDELVDQKKSQELIDAFRETMKTRFLEETHK